jgi:hypothetical protein
VSLLIDEGEQAAGPSAANELTNPSANAAQREGADPVERVAFQAR